MHSATHYVHPSATHYVVLYRVIGDRQANFESNIRNWYNWWQFTADAMLICTSEAPEMIFHRLSSLTVRGQDQFFVLELRQNGLRRGRTDGLVNEDKAWEWLNDHLGQQRFS
ncbi:hypothetical protein [Nannocystis pusilla]|uniref:hypothetical protein n=1 Tax=Nannocystis pusilla TaxID=889268 RepID=UPI003BF26F0B